MIKRKIIKGGVLPLDFIEVLIMSVSNKYKFRHNVQQC